MTPILPNPNPTLNPTQPPSPQKIGKIALGFG